MGRKRKSGKPIHGWVILDKKIGATSTHAVSQLRWLFHARKAGHAGTLDPLASGVLPIAFGEATKTIPYIVDGVKHYEFQVQWGGETETDDKETAPIHHSDKRPTQSEIEAILPQFQGVISQIPPSYSAIKIGGERAYDLARGGQEVELKAREVEVSVLDIMQHDGETTLFHAECSKGTYIRSLARDMGRLLGCYGHIATLKRTRVGPFDISNAISLDFLENLVHSINQDAEPAERSVILADYLLPIETALDDISALAFEERQAVRIKNGQSALIRDKNAPIFAPMAYATHKGQVLAIGSIDKGSFIPSRVLAYGE